MCHFAKGLKNDITFVFSCPGKEEEEQNRPAAGKTGRNLEYILEELNNSSKLDWTRENITITNSWSQVEYKGLNGRTEATLDEILETKNLKRLYKEVKDTEELIICSGDNAKFAINEISNTNSLKAKVVNIPHFSLKKLNTLVTEDVDGEKIIAGKNRNDQKANNKKRLKVICEQIEEQLYD
ncbi:uracil-DNA glycosylase family protein [Viridibacillus arvi]|uniref:uracil-DNA glycosylase family protein n=1 Tax=Viridibacillus arvi TaxID=263475 RepID=UPI0034CD8DB9